MEPNPPTARARRPGGGFIFRGKVGTVKTAITVRIMSANAAAVIAVIGTPAMVREGWGVTLATRRSVHYDQNVNGGWSFAELTVPALRVVGEDTVRAVADAIVYAAAFDICGVARSLDELGVLA
jgi:hypothetical protein